MKNIFKVLLLSIILVTIASCDNEDTVQLTLAPQGSGVITEPAQGTTIVLNPEETQINPALTINWTSSNYGTPTEITYTVEVAATGTNFEEPYVAASTINRYVSFNIGELNGIAVSAGLSPFVEGELDIRLKSSVGTTGSQEQISETVIIFVTPFTTDLPKIAVPGNHQGWDPASAQTLAASAFGETDYEGYVWLDGQFKFIAPNETGGFFWGNLDWGDASGVDGSNTGVLVADGEGNVEVGTGYHFVQADTEALTYSATPISWGVIGNATPTGWDSDTDMIYDAESRTLKLTIDLTQQDAPDNGIKFRANDGWDLNLGDSGADGTMEEGGENIGVPSAGNYTVTLDLSNPREYTYSLVKND
ncbi:MAG: SusF/SusE family outer membrane protein [Lutibacter sp.]|uniref:SusE domain-containing protein n=1 Tax=Lutibacter sp. TaxID=1925666 RepID=UPI0019FA2AB7|nr:SusE domain-containing protein [Lutibacter sp.]NOR28203.1 SusF/SusE family outer membrane protein [Lutibacter sp.]